MTLPPKKPSFFDVGYGKPPIPSRFKKGASGNPTGRPREITPDRARKLALKELFRPVKIREGDRVTEIPGLQAVIRQLIMQAAKGNGPAGRMLIATAIELEQDLTMETASAGGLLNPEQSITTADRVRILTAFVAKTAFPKAD